MDAKPIYLFGEGGKEMNELLGGKGANLQEMTKLGLPVPPFFTITTNCCKDYYTAPNRRRFMDELSDACDKSMEGVEDNISRKFGDLENPLLVSVRSGARVSMPGMMDTILNVGLSDSNLAALEQIDERFARDAYRRLLEMFGTTVTEKHQGDLGGFFKSAMREVKEDAARKIGQSKPVDDSELSPEDLSDLIEKYKDVYRKHGLGHLLHECFENDDPKAAAIQQLRLAVESVFKSSRSPRALVYKEQQGLPADLGTAVNVQAMVFGNTGEDSATGVLFTRDNATGRVYNTETGKREFYGDWLPNAQGEDVVAGIRHTRHIPKLEEYMPRAYKQLIDNVLHLEKHYGDMQDIEFTIEKGRLWILQTRSGKRTSLAKLVTAVDMVEEGLISEAEAVMRFSPEDLAALMHPIFDPNAQKVEVSEGLNAGPGEVSGLIALSPEYACELSKSGKDVILVREETSPEDVHGMLCARGIYTKTGGLTSHAAIVGKQFNKAVVVGDPQLQIIEAKGKGKGHIIIGGKTFYEGEDFISISGTTGKVYMGRVPTIESEIERVVKGQFEESESRTYGYFKKMMTFAKHIKKLGVRANADTPDDAKVARRFGAEGIGLLRTEHTLFKDKDQILAMREMILAPDKEERRKALKRIEPLQRENLLGVLEHMKGVPVTLRLLDPPLDEFLPNSPHRIDEFVDYMSTTYGHTPSRVRHSVEQRIEELTEANPMIGFRGNRLSVVYPEITRMQARSIFEAVRLARQKGYDPHVEIMCPVTISAGEVEYTRNLLSEVAREFENQYSNEELGMDQILFGTMIETPRAALVASEIADIVDFFSFGTNDLTQMSNAMDRNSAGKYLNTYVDEEYLEHDPFVSIDRKGAGRLLAIAVKEGRETKPGLKTGICGEHGGDPGSIDFFADSGLDYVSCGAYSIPVAIIGAARLEAVKG